MLPRITCPHLEAPLPLGFFVDDFPQFCHNSGLTANPKVHNPAMNFLVLSLQCGNAAAGSLKFDNVVPGNWVCSLLYCGQVILVYCCSHDWTVLLRPNLIERLNDVPGNVFCVPSLQHYKKRSTFWQFFVLGGTSRADFGVREMNPGVDHPGNTFPYCVHRTRSIFGDIFNVFHRDGRRENCLKCWLDCWSLHGGCA